MLLLISFNAHARVLEISFNKKNKDKFYLFNAQLTNRGVQIAEGDSVYKNVFNSVFFSFENENHEDSNISSFKDSVFGKFSALFYESGNYLRFKFENRFDFGIVLEFWLKPFTVESGTVLSTEYLSPDGVNREFEVYFKSGRLCYSFNNLFIDDSVPAKTKSVKIISDKNIPLKEWHHHRLIYNPSDGKINYYMDGKLVTQVWATKDSNPGSSVMYLETPVNWYYVLGKGYRGFMDNFFLSPDLKNTFDSSIYDYKKGFLQSRVLNMPSLISIYDIDVLKELAEDTDVTLQYRYSTRPFSDNSPEKIVPWRDYNLVNSSVNKFIKGKYFQFRVSMYPSPNGEHSPLLNSIKIKYNFIDIPSIPLGIMAFSSKGKTTLSIRESLNKNIVAYKLYYGEKKDEYWGKDADEGVSPILIPITEFDRNVENGRLYYTLSNLDLHKVYYMRISALTDDGLESEMSREVSVRVRKLK